MSSLLRELLDEEGGKDMCELLLDAAASVKSGVPPARRTFDLNRFEVVIDGEKGNVAIFDVLEADTGEQVTLDRFAETVGERLKRFLSSL